MTTVSPDSGLCEVALLKNHNWEAIEAYDASPGDSKYTEIATLSIPPSRDLFANTGFKAESNLSAGAHLVHRFDVICRFCLLEKERLMDIFDWSDNAVATVESLVSVKIEVDDMLPKQMCTNCCELLNQCLAFKEQVVSTDAALRRCIGLENQVKQIEVLTKEESFESCAPEITEHDIFDAKSLVNELSEGHKFEELIEEDGYTPNDEMVCDDDDIIGGLPAGKSEPITSSSGTSDNCQQCDNVVSCNCHLDRHIKSHVTISFCQDTNLKAHMSSHATLDKDTEVQTKDINLGKSSASFTVEHDLSIHGSLDPEDHKKQCSQCGKNFLRLIQLRRHVKTHCKNKPHVLKKKIRKHAHVKPYKCPHCSKSFKRPSTLADHVRTHAGEKPYKCPHCSKSFSRPSALADHIRLHTGEKPYKCSHCSKSFNRPSRLADHVRTHTGEKPYKCPQCAKSFGMRSTLAVHLRTHTVEKPYNCPDCSKSFRTSAALVVHVRTHTGEKPYKCLHCSKSYFKSSDLADHIRLHTGEKPYKCPHCSKSFNRQSTLADHVGTHTGEKAYKCPHCAKSFNRPSTLADHVRTHAGEKPYKCTHCSKSFNRHSTLVDHIGTHTGEKAYKCSHCAKSFNRPSTLTYHVRTHAGEMPYKCPHCSKSFNRASALADHVRLHTGEKPYKCSQCSKSFNRPSKLIAHTRKHTGERPFKCSHCSKTFRSTSGLRNHRRKHISKESNNCSAEASNSHGIV